MFDGGIRVQIGSQTFQIPNAAFARTDLRDQLGTTVAVGIRPEALSLASTTTQPGLRGTIVISESPGFETLVYVAIEANPVTRPEVLESVAEPDTVAFSGGGGQHRTPSTTLVARLASGASVRDGQQLALAVDPSRLQFFDLANGGAIG